MLSYFLVLFTIFIPLKRFKTKNSLIKIKSFLLIVLRYKPMSYIGRLEQKFYNI